MVVEQNKTDDQKYWDEGSRVEKLNEYENKINNGD